MKNASKVTKVSIKQGSTKKLNWKTVSKRNRKKIRWKSSNRKIVSVSSNGTIRAKRTGKATVTAKYKKKQQKYKITVIAKTTKFARHKLKCKVTVKAKKSSKNTKAKISVRKTLTPAQTPAPTQKPIQTPNTQNHKVLVAYFSWSGTSERIAQNIISQTGADSFRIDRAVPYSSDYQTTAYGDAMVEALSKKWRFTMRVKKIVSLVLTATIAMGLMAGCGLGAKDSDEQSKSSTTQVTAAPTEESVASETPATEEKTSSNGKVLVVYYSATGTTKAVAQSIADKTGGDLFEIEPKEPYTDDDLNWTDDNSRVSKEHDDESLRDVELTTTKVDNWDSYDTVFIGYPIWWAIAAWPVDNFVKNNDFSGKTVIPFCTSASSGIGESGQLLAEMAGTGDWKEGQRFSGSADDAEVSDWVKDLGYAK